MPLFYHVIILRIGNTMAKIPHSTKLKGIAGLMVAAAGESVSMVKRAVPGRAVNLKKSEEWALYLEFLKVMFNLADRVSTLYLPVQEHPQFMNALEDQVVEQLKEALAPVLGPGTDWMEVTITIGNTVAESRQRYEQYRFIPTEDGPKKEEYLKDVGERVAAMLGTVGEVKVVEAASLCMRAVIPALDAVFTQDRDTGLPEESLARASRSFESGESLSTGRSTGAEMKLISVMALTKGEEIETRWGLHPRFRQDLTPDEVRQLNKLMNRATRILGERYAAVALSEDWMHWNQVGHA